MAGRDRRARRSTALFLSAVPRFAARGRPACRGASPHRRVRVLSLATHPTSEGRFRPYRERRCACRSYSSVRYRRATLATPAHSLGEHLFAGCDLTTAYRRSTFRAEIIEDLAIRQDQEKPLPHRHRGFAFVAIKTGGSEVFKLLLVHIRRSR